MESKLGLENKHLVMQSLKFHVHLVDLWKIFLRIRLVFETPPPYQSLF